MAYILNTEIVEKKTTNVGLRAVYGMGKTRALKVSRYFGISDITTISDLEPEMVNKIALYIESRIVFGNDLKQVLTQIREKQIKIKCYKGQRAKYKLPRRGQRTHTNAKTAKRLR